MKFRFYCQNISKVFEVQLEDYFVRKKQKGLIRLLAHGNSDLAQLDVRAKYSQHHNIYSVRFDLVITNRKNLVGAEESSHDLIEAFNLAFARLASQLRKQESLGHNKAIHKIRHLA